MEKQANAAQGAEPRLTATSVVPGQVIGNRYRLEARLGSGGVGVVFRATHLWSHAPVAVKLVRPGFGAAALQRLREAARRAAMLDSERIARVRDVGTLGSGEPVIVMDLLDGVDLGLDLDRHGAMPARHALNIALQLVQGLAAAHARGVAHGNIKPGNVFLARRADGRFAVKLLDFGMCTQLGDLPAGSWGERRLPWYLSPEQMLDASNADPLCDVWSLGVVLFEMLTQRRPFDGASFLDVSAQVLSARPPSIRCFRPELDARLEAIVTRCLAKQPRERYRSVAELGEELERYATRHEKRLPRPSEPEPVRAGGDPGEDSAPPVSSITHARFRRRMRRAHALGVAGIVMTTGVAALAFGPRCVEQAARGAAFVRGKLRAARARATTHDAAVPLATTTVAPAGARARRAPASARAPATAPDAGASTAPRPSSRGHANHAPTRRHPPRRLTPRAIEAQRAERGLGDANASGPSR